MTNIDIKNVLRLSSTYPPSRQELPSYTME